MTSKKCLIVFYSLTRQTQLVVDLLAASLRREGHHVEIVRLTPAREFKSPMPLIPFLTILFKTYLKFDQTIELKTVPTREQMEAADLIVFGYQPWFLQPSIPVDTFLNNPQMSEPLRGKKVFSLITCRQLWKRSYRIFGEKVRARGGSDAGYLMYEDPSKPPYNMISTVLYILTGLDMGRWKFFQRWFYPFGLSPQTVKQAGSELSELAAKFTKGEI